MVNRNTSVVQSKPNARKRASIGDVARSPIENCSTNAGASGAKTTRKQAKSTPGNGKIVSVDSPSEAISGEAFGLRRVSFLLPDELAKEFDERGGAAWLALVLRDATAGADERQTAPIAAALPVVSKSTKGVEPLPAQKPDDQVHCGRRRAGMR